MYGFRQHPVFTRILFAELTQVCFGQNETILRLGSNMAITIMADVGVGSTSFRPISPTLISSYLLSLLGRKLVRTEVIDESCLDLVFDHGNTLRLFDPSPTYESVVFDVPDASLVV